MQARANKVIEVNSPEDIEKIRQACLIGMTLQIVRISSREKGSRCGTQNGQTRSYY